MSYRSTEAHTMGMTGHGRTRRKGKEENDDLEITVEEQSYCLPHSALAPNTGRRWEKDSGAL